MSPRAGESPRQRYAALVAAGTIAADPAQRAAVELLDDLHARLVKRRTREQGLLSRMRARFGSGSSAAPERGLYLWGGVGRGKTMLMDLFCDCLPPADRQRMHFHRFMQRVHHELRDLAGTPNPLQFVAERLSTECRVLCFDEFFVSDIGDAMILAELLEGLFARGVSLVATSNVVPDRLYENGLQRRRFLPAIGLLQQHTQVHNVDGQVDYRLRVLEQAEIYHAPLDRAAQQSLAASFLALSGEAEAKAVTLEIEGRPIRARAAADAVAWFEFRDLCEGPRSQNDYIELARLYQAVIVANVPRFTLRSEDAARRFISLVDEFYDRNVKLIISAEAQITELYQGERLRFEFERTESRLLEMQSHDYLARSHRP
ncbi:MAG: cell division protein ZapE [Pseudomonadales bacterium]